MNSAIVVLYNPELGHLLELIGVLKKQVNKVVLVDNTPKLIKQYSEKLFLDDNVVYIDLGDNLGIAKAHNEGIKKSIEIGCEYVVIFDQDSSVEDGFVSSLISVDKQLRCEGKRVAAVGPAYIDVKTNIMAPAIQFNGLKVDRIAPDSEKSYTRADYMISSGTLVRTDMFEVIGLMMEQLFIDYVDIEWGLRAKNKNYSCYIANQVVMKHSIGDKSIKVPFTNRYVSIHSDFRKYFIIRNAFYLILYSNIMTNWRIVQIPKTLMYFTFLCIFVSPRLNNFKIFLLALKDAITKNMDKGSMS
ncbi:glycosyltransferase family 2 protein [Acinetobacter schindleri]|uniref:glycosyltransferase family 2 protein n=1 Tax=Acinetobacter schindleri TaxID=108981 RepID=UPI0028983E48|nr:glycosyltransferase family 2 protein [Acinetobacter schindleri]